MWGGVQYVYVFAYFFVLMFYIKFQVPSMWFSSFNGNKRNNGQVRGITVQMFYRIQSKAIFIAKSEKGHNLINILQNSLKS